MMGLFDKMAEASFWDNWETKFQMGYNKYIAPDDSMVATQAEKLNISDSQTHIDIAKDISSWIARNHDYNLSKRWKTPAATIKERVGDCEDYTFLLASLLPHYGVTEFTIHAGNADSEGFSEMHVWLEIDGEVIDPTANALQVTGIDYKPELSFDITTDKY